MKDTKDINDIIPSKIGVSAGVTATDIYTDFEHLLLHNSSVPSSQSSVFSVIPNPIRVSAETEKQAPSPQTLSAVQHSTTDFANWLRSQKLSHASIKNYLSDIRQFLSFAQSKSVSSADEISWLAAPSVQAHANRSAAGAPPLSGEGSEHLESLRRTIGAYTERMTRQRVPRATINRRLASIRKFSVFLGQTISIDNIPADPIPTLLKSFRNHLLKTRHSKKTITNYLSDLRHYLNWAKI